MNLTHEQARRVASRALDGPLSPGRQAALDQHLAECEDCRQYVAQLDQTNAYLAQALPRRWPEAPLDDRRMAKLLRTTRTHVRRTAMQNRVINTLRPFAWGLPVIFLVLLLSWSIRSLRTTPSTTQAVGTTTASAPLLDSNTATPTVQETAPAATATPPGQPEATPASAAPNPVRALVPGDNFRLQAELPQAPQQVTIYQQVLPGPITAEQAIQQAAQLGVEGGQVLVSDLSGLVLPAGAVPNGSYTISNGQASAYAGPMAGAVQFQANKGINLPPGQALPLPEGERVARAETFLKQVGALPADYQIISNPYDDRLVGFVPRLDGLPVYTEVGEPRWDWTTVYVSQDGVQGGSIQPFQVKPAGTVPILSAEQAWQRLLDSPTWQKARYAVINPANASVLRKWSPIYPLDQPLELYGYIHHTQTQSGERWIIFSDYAQVQDPDPKMFEMQQESSVHVWGQFHQDDQRRLWLQIERWEPVERFYYQHHGRLVRSGGQSLIETTQGRFSLVPNVTEALPDGTELDISAFPLKGDSLQWWRMESGAMGSNYRAMLSCTGEEVRGGLSGPQGSFGGGRLYYPQLPDQSPVPADAFNAAYPTGTQLLGKTGQVSATLYRHPDGDQLSLALKIDPTTNVPGGLIWLAEGALDGLEAYHGLPVNIWGTVTGQQDGWPTLRVERFMPQYPGVTPQRFVGKRYAGMTGGQMSVEFVAGDGQSYWLRSGLDFWTNDMLDEIIAVGEDAQVEIEGFVIPGRTYGGRPILYDIAHEYPPDPNTTALQPLVVDQTGSDPASQVTFTRVELAYLTSNWLNCNAASPYDPRQAANLLLQPVWIFHGQLPDGRLIEVQVQALPDELLTK